MPRAASAFDQGVQDALPKLRRLAVGMTRNATAAEDLVQDTIVNAYAGRDGFTEGTNLVAWLARIMRNRFISLVRRRKEEVDIDPVAVFLQGPPHSAEDRIMLREASRAISRLEHGQREAMLMVSIDGMSYEEVSQALGEPVGTVKSRVSRARRAVVMAVEGDKPPEGPRRGRPRRTLI